MSIFKAELVHKYNRIRGRSGSLLGLFIMLATFLAVIFQHYPIRAVFERNNDEGINLIKALLVEQGYSLYSEIWSDQPPLFTYILASVFRVLDYNVTVSRILILFFSCVLLIGYFIYLQMVWGKKHALAGTLILILLPTYGGLSVSVMIGLPAIALAILSLLALTIWHKYRRYFWLIFSAFILCLSVFTKVFTGILVPIFISGLLVDGYRHLNNGGTWQKAFRPAILWILIFASVTIILGLFLIGTQNLWQLLEPHLAANKGNLYQSGLDNHIRTTWTILLLALMGGLFVLLKRRWLSLYPIAWMVMGYVFLIQNTPTRYHHQLLVTIPAGILAGIAIGEVVVLIPDLINSKKFFNYQVLISAIVLVAFVLTMMIRIPIISQHGKNIRSITEPSPQTQFLQIMNDFAPQTNWVITDMPMFAFRLGLPIPPEMAVMSKKRLDTGYLTEKQIIDAVMEWKPEQVLLGRFDFPTLEKFLEDDFQLIHSQSNTKLYVRKDLKMNTDSPDI